MNEPVFSEKAPQALGPYSPAVRAGNVVYCSGQIPIDPAVNAVRAESIGDQTRQVLANLREVLAAAGASLADVVKTTVFLRDMNDFAAMNAVYAEAFGEIRPARSCVEVARLPKDVRVEIEATAVT